MASRPTPQPNSRIDIGVKSGVNRRSIVSKTMSTKRSPLSKKPASLAGVRLARRYFGDVSTAKYGSARA
jgi:hypothetical protein